MPGTTVDITLHGPTQVVLAAQFQITKTEGKHSLEQSLITGDPALVERLQEFLRRMVAELNSDTKEQI